MASPTDTQDPFERIYRVCEQVPAGKVATYGDIAAIVGGGCDARMVGHAMAALGSRAAKVPWQRIINRTGGISTSGPRQRELLEEEGVAFDDKGHVRMDAHHWAGPSDAWARAHGFSVLPPRDAPAPASQLKLF
ncbi:MULTISPECIES: MGMT family protein [Corallococcus]|uniref:MGMT family protein n=1 Tax=Corallococcus TaxID=83461 RepID=UPI00117CED9F|nr:MULTISPECIES: MGMT family protein [Corallococcus]NBD09378.1 6-O-methylguanine DNA methyltransferase [Corallococcus silvisoli]TSC31338.1 6-O-methylguanine DNA methyltransferase [Corallococcus sp. Z5C101001]